MSEIPATKNLLKFVTFRIDSFVVMILCFMISSWLNLYLHQDFDRQSISGFFYFTGWSFLISISFSLLIELTYILVKPIGALLQRSGKLWFHAVPAIAVFFLLIEPFIGINDIISLQSFAAVTVIVFLIVLSFSILLFLPIFHGLNSAFLVAAILISRFFFLPFQHLAFEILSINLYIMSNLVFSLLLYLFFQTRRRIGLSPHYERFRPNRIWFLSLIAIVASIVLVIWIWKNGFFHSLLDTLYLSLALGISLSIFVLMFILYIESFSKHWLKLPIGKICILFLLLTVSTATYLIRSYKPEYVFFIRNTSVGQLLDLFAVLFDQDNDGNSWWPGRDPDDSNQSIRREAKGEYKNRPLNLAPIGQVGSDKILVTYVIPGVIEENPIYLKNQEWANDLTYLAHRWLQPSNQPERSLRALLQGLTSLEEVHRISRRSIFSFAVDDGYRTICLGVDYDQPYFPSYFHSGHWSKLDSGCQVFEPLTVKQLVTSSPVDKFESCVDLVLTEAEKLIAKYQEAHNFIWIHIDTRQCKSNLDINVRRQLLQNRIEQLKSYQPNLPFLTNQSRQMLSLILETGYLPYFYAEPRNRTDSVLFNELLSSHLFLMRWYFADILKLPNSESFEVTQVLRKAEEQYQNAGSRDLNSWIFLQEAPDQHIRWFRDVVDGSLESKLPATILNYDPRRRQFVYSHGIWNQSIEITLTK